MQFAPVTRRGVILQYIGGDFNDSSSFDNSIMHLHSLTHFYISAQQPQMQAQHVFSPDKREFKETAWFKIPVSAFLFPGSVSPSLPLICSASDPLPKDQMTTEW